jgi:nucleotide-binding universal stress UspA family protein
MTVAELKTQTPPITSVAFRHILVATDFSEASRRALCNGVVLAAENKARMSVIHVMQVDWRYAALENPPEIEMQRVDTEQRLQTMIRDLAPEQRVHMEVVSHGPVAEAVVLFIEDAGVDLLVMGTRGRGGLSKLALGSVAEELLRVAPCPVMTIGPKSDIAAIAHGSGFHSILFATDFGHGSIAALPLALNLARTHQGKLILLHMIATMPATTGSLSSYAPAVAAADELQAWEASTRKRALRDLRECLPAETGLEQEPEFVVGTDFLPEGVLLAVAKFKVDWIVMGANRTVSAKAAAHTPWSAVHEVVRQAPQPKSIRSSRREASGTTPS